MEDLLGILVLPLLGAIEMIINLVIRLSLEGQLLPLLLINLPQHHRQQPLQTKFKTYIDQFTHTSTSKHLIEMLKTTLHTMPVFQTLKQI